MNKPGRCATCQHWNQERMRQEWRGAISLEWLDGETEEEHHLRENAAEEPFGICTVIDLLYQYDHHPDPLPLAFTRDGSDYMATLYTQRDFGCVLHTAAASPVVADLGLGDS